MVSFEYSIFGVGTVPTVLYSFLHHDSVKTSDKITIIVIILVFLTMHMSSC